jgi:sugar/nucleoside kinase (ribokinase family)
VKKQTIPYVDVVGVGLNATDTIIQLPHFPAAESKMKITSSTVLPGGQVASAIVACQKWGLSTRYVGKVGDDAAAELQRMELALAGVEYHLISVLGCPSQTSYILVDERTGERTVLWGRDPRVALQPEEVQKDWVTSARALLVDGHETGAAARAASWAREAGIPVTADLDNLYPGVEALLENTDFAICSREFPERLTGETDLLKALVKIQRTYENRVVGSTLGRDGVIVWDGSNYHYCPAFHVEAVDTTGAGDIFHAAFVYSQLLGHGMKEQLSFCCAASALNCTKLGARGGIARVEEIRHLVKNGKTHPAAYSASEFRV